MKVQFAYVFVTAKILLSLFYALLWSAKLRSQPLLQLHFSHLQIRMVIPYAIAVDGCDMRKNDFLRATKLSDAHIENLVWNIISMIKPQP